MILTVQEAGPGPTKISSPEADVLPFNHLHKTSGSFVEMIIHRVSMWNASFDVQGHLFLSLPLP